MGDPYLRLLAFSTRTKEFSLMGIRNKAWRAAQAALRTIYAQVPEIDCKGLCQASCGPIDECVVEIERDTARAASGRAEPFLGLLQYAADPTRKTGCPMLAKDGCCSIHPHRPLICRLYGVADAPGMRCPHGCTPKRSVADREAARIFVALETTSDRFYREEPNK